jgi:DegV family protein with EDD domain
MSGRVAVVTDSTAYLPGSVAAEYGITVVPMQVVVDGRSLTEGVEVSSRDVAEALVSRIPVTTSRPAPAVFAETYRTLAAAGFDAVVSVHLSGDLSGTVSAAQVAAAEVADELTVHVIDSRVMVMALGYCAIAGARRAQAGAGPTEVVDAVTAVARTARGWLYVDTLEYLRRGGRITNVHALLGSALAVKPLLHLVDGRLELMERVRTTTRALARLEDAVVAAAGTGPVEVGIHHLAAPERAAATAARLRARLPGMRTVTVGEVGATIGAHTGPGMLAVVFTQVLPPD